MIDLSGLLERTSRTFALSIPRLPEPTRRATTLAYLLFRIADTFEDAAAWPRAARIQALLDFDELLGDANLALHGVVPPVATVLAEAWTAAHPADHDGYAALVAATPEVLAALADLDVETRAAVIHHARRTAQGMRTFVERSDARGGLRLASLPELRSYCYVVAGIVGELLTDLFVLHSPEAARHEIERALRDNAVAFGEGLQLVNILKDATDDARDGRAYLPADTPRSELLSLARHDLHRAVRYVSALQVAGAPRGYVEFTALPVILAFATLDVVAHEGPGAKLSRATVLEAVRALDERLDAGLPAVGAP